MNKTTLSSAIALSVIASANVNANLVVTSMDFGNNYAASGSINDDGTLGEIQSVDDFFFQPWYVSQETAVITNSNGLTWASSGPYSYNTWDYSTDIALMTDDQVAVGVIFNWTSSNGVPVLAVFDCITTPGECIGQTTGVGGESFGGMQTGPFIGQTPSFNGYGNLSAVPVPVSAWLMASGLTGLIGVARRCNKVNKSHI